MDNSITEITPLVEEILKKTESGEYKWEPMGSNSFCLLAGGYSFTIRSTNFLDGTFGTPVFRFLKKTYVSTNMRQILLIEINNFTYLFANCLIALKRNILNNSNWICKKLCIILIVV